MGYIKETGAIPSALFDIKIEEKEMHTIKPLNIYKLV